MFKKICLEDFYQTHYYQTLFAQHIHHIISFFAASPHRHTGPLHYCSEPSCLEAAAGIIAKMNSSYDPCTDFWNFGE